MEPTQPEARRGAVATAIAASKVLACLGVTAVMLPPQLLVRLSTSGPASFVLPQLWHRALCGLLGIRIERIGAIDTRVGTTYVGNHISHFDILALGACVRGAFIAKGEMASWPGMRLLGAMQQTLFVSRRARDAAEVTQQVAGVRRLGHRLVLFAEGTTSPGESVAPFKSSLFAVLLPGGSRTHAMDDASGELEHSRHAQGRAADEVRIQPFTLTLVAADGHAVRSAHDRDLYAFHGDASAGAHVRRFLRSRGARVRILFHAPIDVAPGTTRKQLAAITHAIVASGVDPAGTRTV